MQCPYCRNEVGRDDDFCAECGKELTRKLTRVRWLKIASTLSISIVIMLVVGFYALPSPILLPPTMTTSQVATTVVSSRTQSRTETYSPIVTITTSVTDTRIPTKLTIARTTVTYGNQIKGTVSGFLQRSDTGAGLPNKRLKIFLISDYQGKTSHQIFDLTTEENGRWSFEHAIFLINTSWILMVDFDGDSMFAGCSTGDLHIVM